MKLSHDQSANDAGPTPVSTGRRLGVLAACFLLLGGLGWVDYVTGYELGFFIFYSAPVGLAAWYAGRWPAVVVALGASLTWWLADRFDGVNFSSRFYFYWNITIHFLAFVINAVTISKIKQDIDERNHLAAELERTRAQLRRQADGGCPVCGSRREVAAVSKD